MRQIIALTECRDAETPADRLRFKMTIFPRIILATEDEAVMRDYYNRMNFSGVRHTEEERA